MTLDPLDRFGERLFEAARREPKPEGAEQRALSAALRVAREAPQRRLSRGALGAMLFGSVAIAAGLTLWVRPKPRLDPISAEPSIAHVGRRAAASSAAPVASAPTIAPTNNLKRSNALPSASVARSAPATLSDELEALKLASTALNAGDASAALKALDRYDQLLDGGKLRAEATLLRIQALARSGNVQAASALAQQFVDRNPDSPLVDRARAFIQTTDLGGN